MVYNYVLYFKYTHKFFDFVVNYMKRKIRNEKKDTDFQPGVLGMCMSPFLLTSNKKK